MITLISHQAVPSQAWREWFGGNEFCRPIFTCWWIVLESVGNRFTLGLKGRGLTGFLFFKFCSTGGSGGSVSLWFEKEDLYSLF